MSQAAIPTFPHRPTLRVWADGAVRLAGADPAHARPWFATKRFAVPVLLLVLTLLMASATGGQQRVTALLAADGDAYAGADADVVAPTLAAAGPQAAAAAGLGVAVRDGDLVFVVDRVECSFTQAGGEFLNTRAQGQFCLVDVAVRNAGAEPAAFLADYVYLSDANGQRFSAGPSAALHLGDGRTSTGELRPGASVAGTVVLDLPAGAVPLAVELHESAFSPGAVVELV